MQADHTTPVERQRHQLPEHEHGKQVAGEGDPDGAARVDKGRHQLHYACAIQCEEPAGEGHDREDGTEQAAQPVDR